MIQNVTYPLLLRQKILAAREGGALSSSREQASADRREKHVSHPMGGDKPVAVVKGVAPAQRSRGDTPGRVLKICKCGSSGIGSNVRYC